MNPIKSLAILLWRIWFYILLIIPILILFPALLVLTSSEKYYPQFYKCARIWAKIILYGMGFYPKIKTSESFVRGKSYMIVANHTSMLDIMLMLTVIKHPFVFVGKKELTKFPIFGFFYRRTCILVDRNCKNSRQEVFSEAQRRLDQGTSICIFPEGGVPEDESIILDTFRDGAFRLAIEHQIPIAPLTLHDTKKRFSYTFFSGKPGKLRVRIHHFISTKSKTQADRKQLKDETRNIILQELLNPSLD